MIRKLFLVCSLALALAAPAQAAPVAGTAQGILAGPATPFPIAEDTTFFTLLGTVLGASGDFAAPDDVRGRIVGFLPVTATVGEDVVMVSLFGAYAGVVTAVTEGVGGNGRPSVGVSSIGTFSPFGVLGDFTPGLATLDFTFFQVGRFAVQGVVGSFTLTGLVPVPVPAALALFGFGLAGLVVTRAARRGA